jgi:hypothetical protein
MSDDQNAPLVSARLARAKEVAVHTMRNEMHLTALDEAAVMLHVAPEQGDRRLRRAAIEAIARSVVDHPPYALEYGWRATRKLARSLRIGRPQPEF